MCYKIIYNSRIVTIYTYKHIIILYIIRIYKEKCYNLLHMYITFHYSYKYVVYDYIKLVIYLNYSALSKYLHVFDYTVFLCFRNNFLRKTPGNRLYQIHFFGRLMYYYYNITFGLDRVRLIATVTHCMSNKIPERYWTGNATPT